MEYNSNVWNPTHKYLIDKIEIVQRQFSKRRTSISHLTYLERLSILELEPLELRRLRFDLIQYYKIFNNLTPLIYSNYFMCHQPSSSSRNPSSFIIKPSSIPNYLLTSFFTGLLTAGIHFHQYLNKLTPSMYSKKLLSVDLSQFLIGSAFDIS